MPFINTTRLGQIFDSKMATDEEVADMALDLLQRRQADARQAREKSLRDEFAMYFLTGVVANPNTSGAGPEMIKTVAEASYVVADAMLEARKKS